MFSFFSEGIEPYRMTEKLGFNLNEALLDGSMNFDFKKKHFNMTVRQYIDEENGFTVTTFNISSHRRKSNVTANLTHITRNGQCLTAIRSQDVVSHKCFGGMGAGKVRLDRIIPV